MSSNPVPVPLVPAADLRHRLRTPLNHIIGYSEMLLEDNPPESAASRLSSVIAEAKSMLETIQRRLGNEHGIASPAIAFELRSELAGGIEKVRGLAWELRSLLPREASGDLNRIEAAASELAQVSPLQPPSPASASSGEPWIITCRSGSSVPSCS